MRREIVGISTCLEFLRDIFGTLCRRFEKTNFQQENIKSINGRIEENCWNFFDNFNIFEIPTCLLNC